MDFNHIPILSIITYIPLVGALAIVFLIPKEKTGTIKAFATFVAVLDFVVSLPLWWAFDRGKDGYQFVEKAEWIPSLGVSYHFGIDGISLVLILLTTLMGVIAIVCSYTAISDRQKEYYVLLLLLQTFMIGTFCCLDLFLFYVFWEVMLVPMYFLIGVWGGQRRLYAAIKFFLYTLAGSVLMLLGIIALYFYNTTGFLGYKGLGNASTFSIEKLTAVAQQMPPELQVWLFFAFFLGFAIKVPMFPFHTWLPDAHTEAPTAGSVILAGHPAEDGTYGFVRFSLPMFPEAVRDRRVIAVMIALAIIGIVYGAMVTLVPEGHEAIDRLLLGVPPGVRDAGGLRPQHVGHAGRNPADDQPRHLDRGALSPGRRPLRAPPHAHDLRSTADSRSRCRCSRPTS
jgi:NADH-quinone oxidoreductase subunit M